MKKLLIVFMLCLSISLGSFLVACSNNDKRGEENEGGDKNITKLSAPVNLAANKQIQMLTWSAVSGANGYVVAINNKLDECSTNESDLTGLTEGETYKIKVKAKNTDETQNSDWSGEIVYIPLTRLAVPSNIAINDGILSWSNVPNTLGYAVVINETTIIVNTVSYDLSNQFDLPNVFGIKVKAIGNEYFADSLFSAFNEYNAYVKLDAPEIKSLREEFFSDKSHTMLTWSKVDNAVSYTIKVTNNYSFGRVGTTSITVTDGDAGLNLYSSNYSFDLKTQDISVLDIAGQGSISVRANTNGLYSESDWAVSKTFDCVRLKTPVIKLETNVQGEYLSWDYNGIETNWKYPAYIVRIVSSAIPGGEKELLIKDSRFKISDVLTAQGTYHVYVSLSYSTYSNKPDEDFVNYVADDYEYKGNGCWFFNSAWSDFYSIEIF